MRKIQLTAVIALTGLSVLSGCSKKSSSPTYSMKATIGNSSFNESAHILADTTLGGLIITGAAGSTTTAANPQIVITIVNWNGSVGTTTFDSTTATGFEEYISNSSPTPSTSKTGTVTITSVTSSRIAGNFSFTCDDGTVVTNGTFTAPRH